MARYYAGIGLMLVIAALFVWAEEHAKKRAGRRWHRGQ